MKSFKIKSHAKINLALNVTGKKSKLHKIESIVSFIGKFSKNISKINTVSLMIKLLDKKKLLNDKKFQIKIVKNIPQKSGMGGGSMNAASLINFFIDQKILKIKKNELRELTKQIGSDVILGIQPKNTILSSNGKITKFDKKVKLYTLIVKPNFGCVTKEIYSKVKKFNKPKFNKPHRKMFNYDYLKNTENSLEQIAFFKYKKLKKIKLFLEGLSSPSFVRMTGSGSALVAYFHSKRACSYAHRHFNGKFNRLWSIVSKTI